MRQISQQIITGDWLKPGRAAHARPNCMT